MKKKRVEVVLFLFTIFFALASFGAYKESQKIITTDEIKYQEMGSVNYNVFLKDRKYYNRDFLEEGMQYISSIIDYIDINFNYNVSAEKVKSYDVNKKVIADVSIVDRDNSDKVIYNKKEVVKDENVTLDKIAINDNIKIDYNKYNDLANEFKTNYGISANCVLAVNYVIEYSAKDTSLKQNRLMSLQIPLSQQMINITKSQNINNSSVYVGKTTKGTVNKIFFILAVAFAVIAVITLLSFIKKVVYRKKHESKYDTFVNKILREYDSYITESKDMSYSTNKPVIKVGSFKELLDVRNNVEKAIIYIKESRDSSKFILIDNEVYEYSVTREELEK